MATEQTGKVIGAMSEDMLVKVLKPLGTGENSESLSATITALKNAILGYTVFEALVSQSDTDDPTVIVLQNTTGITWTPSYDDVGNYFLTPSVEPDADKVAVNSVNGSSTGSISAYWRSGAVNIGTKDGTGAADNDVLNNSFIEIRIYP